MTMHPTLNFPADFPRWATDSGRVLEPSSGVKDTGWQIDDVPPARWMNWIQNLGYQWSKSITGRVINNWWQNTDVSVDDIISALFHPDIGYWSVVTDGAFSPTFYSADGHSWAAGNTLGAAVSVNSNVRAIDSSYYIYAVTSGDIEYSADAGQTAWVNIPSATIGGSGSIAKIHTKYPDSDFAVAVRSSGATTNVRIASSGITGSWAAAAVDPPSVPAGSVCRSLIYTGGTTWLILTNSFPGASGDSKLYKSTDDASNWAEVTGLPVGGAGAFDMAYSRDTGRLVLTGDDGTGQDDDIWYSDDLGSTWTQATLDYKGLTSGTIVKVYKVYYCGGGVWVGSFEPDVSGTDGVIRMLCSSCDNGETWGVPDVHEAVYTGAGNTINSIACDERKVMCFGQDGFNIYSLST